MRRILILFLLCAVARGSEKTLETFDACWRLVKRHFYDPGLHGVDWNAMRDRYRPLADRASPGDALHAVLARMLMELKASHAAILSPEVYSGIRAELFNRNYWTFGMVLEEARPGEVYLRTAYEGGPAPQAGLLMGDRILSIDAVPTLESRHLINAGYDPAPGVPRLFFLRAEPGKRLRLKFQRRAGGPLREVRVAAQRTNGVEASAASVRVIKRGVYRLGTMHIWYCQPGVPKVLRKAIEGPFKDCDALVLDVRGRGGARAVTNAIVRLCKQWNKPLTVLIDKRTRSAKEMLALRVRNRRLGWLVGEKTEGAVLGAGFFRLPDNYVVELPVADVVIDGVRLEGKGVAPDVSASVQIRYAAGHDALFEQGCLVAIREIARRRGHRIIFNRLINPRRGTPIRNT